MKKALIIILLLFSSSAAYGADEELVLESKKCYASLFRVYCNGIIRNTAPNDINNVIVRFSSPTYLGVHAPKINTDIYDDIDFIPAGETMTFSVVWDTVQLGKNQIDPDILREYILTSIQNNTMEITVYRQVLDPQGTDRKDTKPAQKGAPEDAKGR